MALATCLTAACFSTGSYLTPEATPVGEHSLTVGMALATTRYPAGTSGLLENTIADVSGMWRYGNIDHVDVGIRAYGGRYGLGGAIDIKHELIVAGPFVASADVAVFASLGAGVQPSLLFGYHDLYLAPRMIFTSADAYLRGATLGYRFGRFRPEISVLYGRTNASAPDIFIVNPALAWDLEVFSNPRASTDP